MSKQGCWNNLYRYNFYLYRYRLPIASLYRYNSTCTGTPYGFLPKNVRDFAFSNIFHPQLFSNSSHIKNPPWNLPKNNTKCGLDSIKSISLKLGLFTQIQIKKKEVRVLIFLTLPLQISSCMLLGLLGARNGKQSQPRPLLLANPRFSPLSPSFLPQKRDLLTMSI